MRTEKAPTEVLAQLPAVAIDQLGDSLRSQRLSKQMELVQRGCVNVATLHAACFRQFSLTESLITRCLQSGKVTSSHTANHLKQQALKTFESQQKVCEDIQQHIDSVLLGDPRMSEDEQWFCEVSDISDRLFRLAAVCCSADILKRLRSSYKESRAPAGQLQAADLPITKNPKVANESALRQFDKVTQSSLRYKCSATASSQSFRAEGTTRHLHQESDLGPPQANYQKAFGLLRSGWTLQKSIISAEVRRILGHDLVDDLCRGLSVSQDEAFALSQCLEIGRAACPDSELTFLLEIDQGLLWYQQWRFPEARLSLEAALRLGEGKGYSAYSYWVAIYHLATVYVDECNGEAAIALFAKWSRVEMADSGSVDHSIRLMLEGTVSRLRCEVRDAVVVHERVRDGFLLPPFWAVANSRLLTLAYIQGGHVFEAKQAFEAAYTAGLFFCPKSTEYGLVLADSLTAEGKFCCHQNCLAVVGEARAFFESRCPNSHRVAVLYSRIGLSIFRLYERQETERLLEESERILATTRPNSIHTAINLTVLGRIYTQTQRPFADLLERAQAIFLAVDPSHDCVLENFLRLGKEYLCRSRLDLALSRMLMAKELVWRNVSLANCDFVTEIADILCVLGRYADAEELCKVLTMRSQLVSSVLVKCLVRVYHCRQRFDLIERQSVRSMKFRNWRCNYSIREMRMTYS